MGLFTSGSRRWGGAGRSGTGRATSGYDTVVRITGQGSADPASWASAPPSSRAPARRSDLDPATQRTDRPRDFRLIPRPAAVSPTGSTPLSSATVRRGEVRDDTTTTPDRRYR